MASQAPQTRALLEELARSRQSYSLPPNARQGAQHFVDCVLGLLFPHFANQGNDRLEAVTDQAERLQQDLVRLLRQFVRECRCPAEETAERFLARLPEVYRLLQLDAQAIYDGDPAAESLDEVIFAYPGFFATAVYRVAHVFHDEGISIFPRLLTEYAHQKSGIDIHPGAEIGERFMIDHGTGVVIGATTVIGDNVRVYQGVTLGALSVAKSLADVKRHPTLEDNVVVYSNATILGGQTVVGRDSIIGGNVWLTESVPPKSVVTRTGDIRVRSPQDAIEFHI